MKLFIYLVGVITGVCALTAEEEAEAKNYMKIMENCMSSEQPTADDMTVISGYAKGQGDLSTLSQAGKCYLGCQMESLGLLKNGAYSREIAEAVIKKKLKGDEEKMKIATKYIDICEKNLSGVGTDKCVTGPILMTCVAMFDKEFVKPK